MSAPRRALELLALIGAICLTSSADAEPQSLAPAPVPALASSVQSSRLAAQSTESALEALQADASSYAALEGVTPSEAMRRLQAQEASVPLIDRLAETYRDRLAGVVIEHRPSYRIVLVVTGPPAPDVLIATAPFGVPVLLRTGAGATRVAVLAAIAAHQADIRAALPEPPGMGVDPATGALLVLARAGDLDGDGDEAATAARLQAIAGVPVEVRVLGDLTVDTAAMGGGRVVGGDAEQPHRYVCTSGFVVTDGTQTALATAAHCPDALSYAEGATRTPLPMIGAWGAGSQDVQIHAAPQPLAPLFHADGDGIRTVATWRAHASTRAGDVVCHRGERTGYSCALVRFPDFAPPGDLCAGPCPATWVAVDGPGCKGGDSGGPVFLGQIAFGLVKGETAEHELCRLYYYMSVDYLPTGWTTAYAMPIPDPAAPPITEIPQ